MPQTLQNRYRDLNLSFIPNPVKKDISTLADADAVKQSVVNLVMTKNYERPFHPEIGCVVTALLFDNMTAITANNIKSSITNVIMNFEPRVQLQQVVVDVDYDNNGYNVTVTFYVLNVVTLQTVSMFLQRLR